MPSQDYENAVPITRDIYWVGFYDEKANLHCNPYLLIDGEEAVIFDPGSIPHFPIVMRKIIDLIRPESIRYVVASHQDPDVCGNLAVLEDVIGTDTLKILAHINTIRLIRHYGIKSELLAVDRMDYRLKLGSGRVLDFIFTPFLHSPGAIATFDSKTRSLFTSDIFGTISTENWSLFARGDFLTPMTVWHQTYMSSGRALADCMTRFAALDPMRILPQHGSVLEGDQVRQAMDHLRNLPCGTDLPRG